MSENTKVGMTLNYIIDSSRAQYDGLPAMGMALTEPLTYTVLHDRIIALAAMLRRDGIGKGDCIGILAENSHNWGTVYFAVVRLGAVVVPILPDLSEDDVHYIFQEMNLKILFTTQSQIEKVYEIDKSKLSRVITLDNYKCVLGIVNTTAFTEYLKKAMDNWRLEKKGKSPLVFEEVTEDELASIIYTSGTLGYPKAVMLSHKNLTANVYSAAELFDIQPGSVFLSILPVSHIYEFTCGFLLPLVKGGRIAYAGKTPTPVILQKLCKKEKPFAIFVVPLILEKIFKKRILPRIEKSRLLSLGCKTNISRRLIYKKLGKELLDFFGGHLQLMGIGGAGLNGEVERFLSEAGFPYLVGYGLTETAPLLSGGPAGDKSITMGSCGKSISNVQVKIVNQNPETGIGEIHACGPNIMLGYYNDKRATDAVLSEDGWLATGDLGWIDEEGNLHVYGRMENVIIMDDGMTVSPEIIEYKMNAYHWVVESLLVENNGELDAWVYPDYELIDEQTSGRTQGARHDYIDTLLKQLRQEINEQLPENSRIAAIFERREPFMKTATHKIKRYLYDSQTITGSDGAFLGSNHLR